MNGNPVDRRTLQARYVLYVKIRTCLYDMDVTADLTRREKSIAVQGFHDHGGGHSYRDIRDMEPDAILDQLWEDMNDWINANSRR